MTVLCHKRSTVHSIFQISISRNTICAEMVDFRKPGHIIIMVKYLNNIYTNLLCVNGFCIHYINLLIGLSTAPSSMLSPCI